MSSIYEILCNVFWIADAFDESEENKFEYTDIFQQYTALIGVTIFMIFSLWFLFQY